MRRGDLDDLAAFAAVARTRSFTRASVELGMSPSGLSHAIRALEQRLGVRLLARTTRSVAPTAAGERLMRSLDPALTEVGRGLAALADWRGEPSGAVRLTTFAWAAHAVLEPVLPRFLADNPGVTVEVHTDDRLADIVESGFDAGIRIGDAVQRDMVAVRVGPDLRMAVVATPDYFERHPPPETLADLDDHDCVGYRLAGGGLLAWEFTRDGREIRVRTRGRLVVDDGVLLSASVRAGVGLGYMFVGDVEVDLAAGRLIEVLPGWCRPFPGCHLYYPNRDVTPALRALVEALRWRRDEREGVALSQPLPM